MRRRIMEAEEIRLRRRGRRLDKGDRPLAQHVGDIALPLHRRLTLVEIMLAAIAKMCVVAGIAAHDPEELVIPALQGTVARQIAEMPFADERGAVAGTTQQRRESRVTRRYAHLWRVAIAPPQRFDEPDRQPVLIASSDQRNPRIGAQRRIGIRLSEADPFTGSRSSA